MDPINIEWYENDGGSPAKFTKHLVNTICFDERDYRTSSKVRAAIFDGDGDQDMDIFWAYDTTMGWWENNNGTFTMKVITTSNDWAPKLLGVDVDGDGDMDILTISHQDDISAWWENNGNGDFLTKHIISTTIDGPESVVAADIDGDDDMDYFSASSNEISWWENINGEFTQHVMTTTADGAYSVATADIDGDQDMDAVSASRWATSIVWWENNGSGSFTMHYITETGHGDLVTADIDNDGWPDVFAIDYSDGSFWWYKNMGEGENPAPPPPPPGGIVTPVSPPPSFAPTLPFLTQTGPPATSPAVVALVLVNTVDNSDVLTLRNCNLYVDLDIAQTNIRAEVQGDVRSVVFTLESVSLYDDATIATTTTENFAPFALFGDQSGDYTAGNLESATNHTLTAIPYTGQDGSGTQGTPLTVSFGLYGSDWNIYFSV